MATTNNNYSRNSRKVIVDGKVVEDYCEETRNVSGDYNRDKSESDRLDNYVEKEVSLPSPGKVISIVTLTFGVLAVIFAILPLLSGIFVAVFWLLYIFAFISVLSGVVAMFKHRVLAGLAGILLSFGAVIAAGCSMTQYALAAAGSVNAFGRIAKTFIDALQWPF